MNDCAATLLVSDARRIVSAHWRSYHCDSAQNRVFDAVAQSYLRRMTSSVSSQASPAGGSGTPTLQQWLLECPFLFLFGAERTALDSKSAAARGTCYARPTQTHKAQAQHYRTVRILLMACVAIALPSPLHINGFSARQFDEITCCVSESKRQRLDNCYRAAQILRFCCTQSENCVVSTLRQRERWQRRHVRCPGTTLHTPYRSR